MQIEEYFHQLDAVISGCPRVALRAMLYDERSETKGFIRGLIHFDDGSELHVREFIDVSAESDRYKYAYHYMRGESVVFRYDNSADTTARELATYPHHKHVGDGVHESAAPTLREVLEEIMSDLP